MHRALTAPTRRTRSWWLDVAGGPVRARVTLLLACVLGLDAADMGGIGSIAGNLEHSLRLSNLQLGLVAAAPSLCLAVASLPMGVLTDRTNRVRLLWVTMLAWTVAQAVSGIAQSFGMLLLIRLALGAATAAAGPAIASLVGDLFPTAERSRIWGLILSGELIGAAFGFMIAGEASTFGPGSWRYAFLVLAIPSLLGAIAVRRSLREPARGGASRLEPGATSFVEADDAFVAQDDAFEATVTQKKAERQRVPAREELVLRTDPARLSVWQATRYALRVRTNVVLIIASSLGYLYFAGITTFGLLFFQDRFHIAHGTATVLLMLLGGGGLIGVIGGGRVADWWLHTGKINSRIIIGGLSFTLAALFFLPGLLASRVVVSMPFFIAAGVAFGARNPSLDAARLDIMHHCLWGRAEAVRSVIRRIMTATAPIIFGALADQLVSGHAHAASNGVHGFGANANGAGLRLTFLVLLILLAIGGILTFMATRTFPRDVATAVASEEATAAAGRDVGTESAQDSEDLRRVGWHGLVPVLGRRPSARRRA